MINVLMKALASPLAQRRNSVADEEKQ